MLYNFFLTDCSIVREVVGQCVRKENGHLTHLLWILVFDDQQDQIGLMCLRVLVL